MQRILHALQCRGSQPPQSRVQFALRLKRALHAITQKISLAPKIRQRRLFLRRRMPRRSSSLHQFIKIHARSQRPHRSVRGRTVKIILHPHRRRRIQKQNPNLGRPILSGKLHTLGAALYVRFVRTRAATFTNGHAISSDSAWTRWESMARRTKTGNTVTTRAVLVATLFITRSSASPASPLDWVNWPCAGEAAPANSKYSTRAVHARAPRDAAPENVSARAVPSHAQNNNSAFRRSPNSAAGSAAPTISRRLPRPHASQCGQ